MVRRINIKTIITMLIILTIFTATIAAAKTTPPASIKLNIINNGQDMSTQNNPSTIKFITIGDPHLIGNTSADQYKRLKKAINYINKMADVDFVVIMGDIVDAASTKNFNIAKNLLNKLNKTYYVVPGNHDLGNSIMRFEGYFGPSKHIEYINGYQLVFVGLSKDKSGKNHWVFDFNTANSDDNTIIFSHGPVQPKPGKTSCVESWGVYYGYACDMQPELSRFTNLLAFYDGHVHVGTNQIVGNTLYVTSDNLGGNGPHSDYIGYTIIENNTVTYSMIKYK